LASQESLKSSPLGSVVSTNPDIGEFRLPEGEIIEDKGRRYGWVELLNRGITLPPGTLEKYGIRIGDRLLVIRGSGLAIGFAVRGPIVEEAKKHPELAVFEPEI